jgi:DNA (cytosine-5)-methyltransferase 1
MECRFQVEIDPWCRKVLAKHWPDVARHGDVRNVGRDNLEAVDLIAGGFPCQPFSLAGQRRGESDDRNLWPEMRRIVEDLRPRWVLAENVPGIISLYLDTVLSDLEALGYTTGAVVLPACAFDAPHIRQRLFIVANAASECRGARGAEPAGQQRQAGLAHGGAYVADAASIAQREPADQADAIAVGRAAWHEPGHGSRNDAYTDREPLGWLTKPRQERGHWVVEPAVGRVVDGLPNRVDRLRGLGNAVVPQVVEHIGRLILDVHG